MEQSQIDLIKEQAFINIRENVVNILTHHNLVEYHLGNAGWWVQGPEGQEWVSLYEVLESARD